MPPQRLAVKEIITFLILTLTFSLLFYPQIIRTGIGTAGGLPALALVWCPGAAAIVTRFLYQKNLRGMGWGWGKTRYEFYSYIIPILYGLAGYLIIWSTGLGKFPNHEFIHSLGERFGKPNGSAARLIVQYVLVAGGVDLIGASIGALGEEIGWRGLLVPELAKVTSFTNTALVSSIIWALWHYPLIFLAGYNGGTSGWYSVLCFTVLATGIGTVLAWMRLKSGSVWTAMLLHASHNLFIQGIFGPMTKDTPVTKYVGGEFGAVLAVIGLLTGLLFWRKRSQLLTA